MERLEQYAKQNNIPIMQKDGILYLKKYIKQNKVKTILEIGSAIGYSAIQMALVDKEIQITTIEKDQERYKQAKENIKKQGLESQIKIILDDALETKIEEKFDLIFIDAAKAQYIKFFEKYKKNLNKNGTIITDNLNFHGLTNPNVIIKSRNLRQLVKKINNYKEYLKENQEFQTKFIDIGDGIAISKQN